MAIRRDFEGRLHGLSAHRGLSRCGARARVLGTCLLFALTVFASSPAGSEGLDENQVKAAYLFNFARYVEWPRSAFDSKSSSIEIGVVGGGTIFHLLKKTVVGKKVGNRTLRVLDFASPSEGRDSHILFVPGDADGSDLKQIVDDLEGTHAFVVADADGFAKKGGIANFIVSDQRVKFAINERAAKRAGLKVSSKLLRLAELVD